MASITLERADNGTLTRGNIVVRTYGVNEHTARQLSEEFRAGLRSVGVNIDSRIPGLTEDERFNISESVDLLLNHSADRDIEVPLHLALELELSSSLCTLMDNESITPSDDFEVSVDDLKSARDRHGFDDQVLSCVMNATPSIISDGRGGYSLFVMA